MELAEYANVLRRRWPVIVCSTLLAALAAFGWAWTTPPSYTATAKVYVSLNTGESTSDLLQGSTYVKNLIESYAALTDMPVVLDPVADDLRTGTTGRELAEAVTADSPLNTSIIEIEVVDGAPERAAQIADAVAQQLSATVVDLSPATPSGGQSIAVTVVSPAEVPQEPSAPRTQLLTAASGAAGLALSIAIVLLWSVLDTRIRSAKDLEMVSEGTALLGSIPLVKRKVARVPATQDPLSPRAEAYRRVQTNLSFVDATTPARVLVVTSSIPAEGKSTTAINLASTFAENGSHVLLIDGDMRRPSVAPTLGLEGAAGLTTVLVGRATMANLVQRYGPGPLDILPLGPIPPNPHQLIASDATRDLLAAARSAYDVVIVDAPPLLPVSDAAVLSTMADGVVVVVGARRVRRQQLTQALRALAGVEAPVLGLILAFAPRSGPGGTYYGYRTTKHRWAGVIPGSRRHDPLDLPSTTGAISVVPGFGGARRPGPAPVPGGVPGLSSGPRPGVKPAPSALPGAGGKPGPSGKPGPPSKPGPSSTPRPPRTPGPARAPGPVSASGPLDAPAAGTGSGAKPGPGPRTSAAVGSDSGQADEPTG
ncbi:capsular exopolysaccharide family [Promicromonospora umidemergens]|uniref:non-specific protein-tyrosine kinase n=1 Tax=Promicromonospora umidemergens TaxID=629679 RepID=A0ABP8Y5Y5_9MICO|nr:polysaccharide biosynthesis tyrosine autokinase [Promicromonospora umidemergens]MCP2282567.1 capsular exopolysaccharide family [Promicromonospora umidemergens]